MKNNYKLAHREAIALYGENEVPLEIRLNYLALKWETSIQKLIENLRNFKMLNFLKTYIALSKRISSKIDSL